MPASLIILVQATNCAFTNASSSSGELENASQAHRTAINQMNGHYPEAHYSLGLVLMQQEKLDEATEVFRRAIDQQPVFPSAYYSLSLTLQKAGRLEEAINNLYLATEFDKAEALLKGVLEACEDRCSPQVKAKAWMYVGIVRGSVVHFPKLLVRSIG